MHSYSSCPNSPKLWWFQSQKCLCLWQLQANSFTGSWYLALLWWISKIFVLNHLHKEFKLPNVLISWDSNTYSIYKKQNICLCNKSFSSQIASDLLSTNSVSLTSKQLKTKIRHQKNTEVFWINCMMQLNSLSKLNTNATTMVCFWTKTNTNKNSVDMERISRVFWSKPLQRTFTYFKRLIWTCLIGSRLPWKLY